MAYIRTLLQLRTSFLRRGQYEGSQDLDPPGDKSVANEFINDALEESYNLCVKAYDDFYTILSPTFTTVSGTSSYALPDDFYKLRKVEILVSGVASDPAARWGQLFPIDIDDSHRLTSVTSHRYKYRESVAGLTLVPSPGTGETLRVYYIPTAPQLTLDTDTVQFDTPVEQKLVIHIALRDAYQRQDLPTEEIEAKIAQLAGQLRSIEEHDAGQPFYLGSSTGDDVEDCY